jgi:CheY-like chemotaxis protein
LDYTAFSRSGLIKQLEYEGYSTEEATYGVDALNTNWNDQAVKSAKNYLDYTAFSRSGLIEQLEYEGFTTEEATYGASANGY